MRLEAKLILIRAVVVLFAFSLMTYSCEKETIDFTGCWSNLFEEGNDVYKLCGSQTFQFARFRQEYEFRADGTVRFNLLGNLGGSEEVEGQWTYHERKQELSIFSNDTAELLVKLRVARIDQKTLSLQEL